ncbi:MAG: gliding motility-associated C-terminal domain-containing protein [Bacteroidota bacterium]
MRFTCLLAFVLVALSELTAQECSPQGNIAIFSNYDGGELIIDVNQDIPNLKIGISSYEPTEVTFTGAFVGNITEIHYAGYQPFTPGNNNCGTVNIASVDSPPGSSVVFQDTPPVTLTSPFGDNTGITGCNTCENNVDQGGSNTSEQIIDYFLTVFDDGNFRFLKTQYDCWCGTQDLNQPATCCFELNNQENVFIQASPSTSLCDGTITLDAGPGFDSYSWIPNGEDTQIITVDDPGLYTVIVDSDCGNASDGVLIEECTGDFFVTLEDRFPCDGEPAEIFATVTGGVEPLTFEWTPDFGTGPGPFFEVFGTTTVVDVTVTDATGATASASALITPSTSPIIELGEDEFLCDVTFEIVPEASNGILTWDGVEVSPTLVVSEPGIYTATVTTLCGTASDDIEILECPDELLVSLPGGTICQEESFELLASPEGGQEPYTYDWDDGFPDGPGPYTVSPDQTTDYTVTVTDASGTVSSATATVTVIIEDLDIELGPNQDLCDGTVVLDATTAGALSYTWSNDSESESIAVDDPGVYSVTVTGQCGTAFDQVTVVECDALLVQLEGPEEICEGETGVLSSSVTGGEPPYIISWVPSISDSVGDILINPAFDQNYTVTILDSQGATAQESIFIRVNSSNLEVTLPELTRLCPDESVILDAFNEDATSYLWSTGETSSAITVSSSGDFVVEVSSECDLVSATSTVEVFPDYNNLFNDRQILTCDRNFPLQIGYAENEDYTILWSTGEFSDAIEVPSDGVYIANYSSICSDTTVVWRIESEDCDCEIYVPNAFTPDDNNLNEAFKPVVNCETVSYKFEVWNRLGQMVFESTNPLDAWKGESPDSDFFGGISVYYWRLIIEPEVQSIQIEKVEKDGFVTLLR